MSTVTSTSACCAKSARVVKNMPTKIATATRTITDASTGPRPSHDQISAPIATVTPPATHCESRGPSSLTRTSATRRPTAATSTTTAGTHAHAGRAEDDGGDTGEEEQQDARDRERAQQLERRAEREPRPDLREHPVLDRRVGAEARARDEPRGAGLRGIPPAPLRAAGCPRHARSIGISGARLSAAGGRRPGVRGRSGAEEPLQMVDGGAPRGLGRPQRVPVAHPREGDVGGVVARGLRGSHVGLAHRRRDQRCRRGRGRAPAGCRAAGAPPATRGRTAPAPRRATRRAGPPPRPGRRRARSPRAGRSPPRSRPRPRRGLRTGLPELRAREPGPGTEPERELAAGRVTAADDPVEVETLAGRRARRPRRRRR